MDALFRTPLLDVFRRGEAPAGIRMLAARGALAPRAHEQLALLVLLTADADPDIRGAAEKTLGRLPGPALAAFLARHDVSSDLRQFFAARGVEPAASPAPDADRALLEDSEADAAGDEGPSRQIATLSVIERVKLAMRGRREERAVLVRDPNRLVAAAVLSSPKLTESEVESFARMANVSEEVLRVIGTTRAWVKKYPVAVALARNPKTPLAISLPLIPFLTERDVKQIAIDRNAPEGLRIHARKVITAGQLRRR